MKKFVAILLMAFGAKAVAFSETGLVGLTQDVANAYSWTCTGRACDSVWNEQVRSLTALANYVDRELPDGLAISNPTGVYAQRVADVVCRSQATGDSQTMQWLASAENRGLYRLAVVQSRASLKPRTCTKTVR